MRQIILASISPRRKKLLDEITLERQPRVRVRDHARVIAVGGVLRMVRHRYIHGVDARESHNVHERRADVRRRLEAPARREIEVRLDHGPGRIDVNVKDAVADLAGGVGALQ